MDFFDKTLVYFLIDFQNLVFVASFFTVYAVKAEQPRQNKFTKHSMFQGRRPFEETPQHTKLASCFNAAKVNTSE